MFVYEVNSFTMTYIQLSLSKTLPHARARYFSRQITTILANFAFYLYYLLSVVNNIFVLGIQRRRFVQNGQLIYSERPYPEKNLQFGKPLFFIVWTHSSTVWFSLLNIHCVNITNYFCQCFNIKCCIPDKTTCQLRKIQNSFFVHFIIIFIIFYSEFKAKYILFLSLLQIC